LLWWSTNDVILNRVQVLLCTIEAEFLRQRQHWSPASTNKKAPKSRLIRCDSRKL
jgi:hypothetical protein